VIPTSRSYLRIPWRYIPFDVPSYYAVDPALALVYVLGNEVSGPDE
tara:strand:- start:293 stop:430 length:138 start_codon:yes stop_codon:yes gene_type:complete